MMLAESNVLYNSNRAALLLPFRQIFNVITAYLSGYLCLLLVIIPFPFVVSPFGLFYDPRECRYGIASKTR